MSVNIFTDGGSRPIGEEIHSGWGVFARLSDGLEVRKCGSVGVGKSNNVAELKAFIEALEYVLENKLDKTIFWLDSRYVIDGTTKFMNKWSTNGWLTKQGRQVANIELWKKIHGLKEKLEEANIRYKLKHVYAHTNDNQKKKNESPETAGNREADLLATKGITLCLKGLPDLYEESNPKDEKEVKEKAKKLKAPDVSPMISGKRLWFTTNTDKVDTGGLYTYMTCEFEDGKEDLSKYFGKPAADAFYSVYFTKKTIPIIEQVIAMQNKYVENDYEYPVLLLLDALLNKKNYNTILENGDDCLGNDNGMVSLWNSTQLTRLMSPALLSSFAGKYFSRLNNIGMLYLQKKLERHEMRKIDITEYLVETNEKGKQKISSDIKQSQKAISLKLDISGSKRKVTLTFGVDLPKRNNLAKIIKENNGTKVYLIIDGENPMTYKLLTAVETDEELLVSESPQSSLRVICK